MRKTCEEITVTLSIMVERTLLTANVVYNGLGTPRKKGAMVIQNLQDEEKIIAIDDLATA